VRRSRLRSRAANSRRRLPRAHHISAGRGSSERRLTEGSCNARADPGTDHRRDPVRCDGPRAGTSARRRTRRRVASNHRGR
jgi:hypothetical protein